MNAGVLLSVGAVAVATAVVIALVLPGLGGIALSRRERVASMNWAALLLAPVVVAGLTVIALLVPSLTGGCHCMAHDPHHPHLCPAHPVLAAPLLVPAALLLATWLALVVPRVVRVMADAFRTERWLAERCSVARVSVDGVTVRLVEAGAPVALTVGARKPEIVFDVRLWNALDSEERRAIVHHEHAHVVRHDALTLFVLRVCAALCLVPGATRLIDRWRASAELECDRHAGIELGDPLVVASALLSVERLCCAGARGTAFDAALAARPGQTLERRVRALVDWTDARRPGLANDVFGVACVALGFALLTLAWPSDLVHHAVETLIGWAVS